MAACRAGTPPKASGDQTPEQAFNMAVDGFRGDCHFDGVEPPSESAVAQRMRTEFAAAHSSAA